MAPCKWDDPFENILERVRYRRKSDGQQFLFPLRDCAYGQCWTLRPDHDAAWRSYLPDKNGAQITSTIRHLYLSLKQSQNQYPLLACWIGRVTYHEKKWFSRSLLARVFKEGGTRRQVDTLLWEKEVRLLYLDPRRHSHGHSFHYPINPRALISRVTLDPRMPEHLAKSYTKLLGDKLGFAGKIVQSSLYRCPNMEISV